jgi:hypothetical protein
MNLEYKLSVGFYGIVGLVNPSKSVVPELGQRLIELR